MSWSFNYQYLQNNAFSRNLVPWASIASPLNYLSSVEILPLASPLNKDSICKCVYRRLFDVYNNHCALPLPITLCCSGHFGRLIVQSRGQRVMHFNYNLRMSQLLARKNNADEGAVALTGMLASLLLGQY